MHPSHRFLLSVSSYPIVNNSASVIPYKEPSAEKSDDVANTMATTLPMVAVSLPYLAFPLYLADKRRCLRGTSKKFAAWQGSELLTKAF